MQKFWMIHGDGCSAPAYRHQTLESALDEARRLATKHPDTGFVVLESIVVAQADPRPVTFDWLSGGTIGGARVASLDIPLPVDPDDQPF